MTVLDQPRAARWWLAVLVAVGLAAGYIAWAPHTADLAGQTARAELFRRSGYVPFWSGWYAGISTTGYSLTTPPLLGWFGAVWLGGIAIIATALTALPLVRNVRRPTAGAVAIVVAATLNVISGRTTFAAGVVVALLALAAAQRRRSAFAGLLALLATATSPVAGFLLLIVAVGIVLVDSGRRWAGVVMAVGVLVTLGVIAWLSTGDGGGYEPFTRTSLLMAVGTALVVVLTPVGRRIRTVAVLTVVMLLAVYVVHSPIGANATRISILGAAPAIVCVARGKAVMVLAAIVAALLPFAQLHNDLAAGGDHDSSQTFVAPLLQQLETAGLLADHRAEIVDTATHWPSTYLSPRVRLARGWERQTDEWRNPELYGRPALTAASYRAFLDRSAVSVVAVPQGVPLDYGSTREAALISAGLPYLQQIFATAHWIGYAVTDPTPIVPAPATFERSTDTGVEFSTTGPGRFQLRLRWSPYLVVSDGSVSKSSTGDAVVTVRSGGEHDVHGVWRLP